MRIFKIIMFLMIPLLLMSKEFKCGDKQYCKQMESCEEAMFYLEKCELSNLNKDKDGIPCEKLCKDKQPK